MSKAPVPSKGTRCAVYTRKSSEEGLEQAFNSLHAQREACEAYIKSQRHEGWSLIPTAYDDGGWSGGNLDRPALQVLLEDIRAGKVDVVVVYKIDRLTRSLFDFAKIVEIFDAQNVSFVSVTQAFNTTTSMGRLTLNVLLSFAQFEREVTGERIRDKFAASKKKGMWMGGNVPLGYDIKDRKLAINESEAGTVRTLFDVYVQLGTVRKVKAEADRLRLRTKSRLGTSAGGLPFRTGHLYTILRNPLYIRQVHHKGQRFAGDHPAIIEQDVWDKAQAQLASNVTARRTGASAKDPSLLAGLLIDRAGNRMTPSHAVKDGKRYRYYVSNNLVVGHDKTRSRTRDHGVRVPAHEIERPVIEALVGFLQDPPRLLSALNHDDTSGMTIHQFLETTKPLETKLTHGAPAEQRELIQALIRRIGLGDQQIIIEVDRDGVRSVLQIPTPDELESPEEPIVLSIAAQLRRIGKEVRLVISGATQQAKRDPALIKAIARAHVWFASLKNREVESISDLGRNEKIERTYVRSLLRFAFLAPDITEAILEGTQPSEATLDRIVSMSPFPTIWAEQRALLGFPSR
jgi:site-specific DNA recombinase